MDRYTIWCVFKSATFDIYNWRQCHQRCLVIDREHWSLAPIWLDEDVITKDSPYGCAVGWGFSSW